MTLKERFDQCEDDFLEFKRVENPPHPRPDISALIVLDRLVPSVGQDIISGADHDIVFLDIDCDDLNEAASDADIQLLRRCGVHYSTEFGCLAMFV